VVAMVANSFKRLQTFVVVTVAIISLIIIDPKVVSVAMVAVITMIAMLELMQQ
jgi:hypothetical protein